MRKKNSHTVIPAVLVQIALLLQGCITSKIITPEDEKPSIIQTKGSCETHSKDSLFYYPESDCWIKPQADPYNLCYFVSAAKQYYSEQSSSSARIKPSATHYALTVYPKNESEINQLLSFDGVNLSYVPFGYERLSDDVVPSSMKGNAMCYTYPFRPNPNIGMPVMYVVWPTEIPIPDNIEYNIEYEAFLPDYSQASIDGTHNELYEIENIAIGIANPLTKLEAVRGRSNRTLSGRIMNSDNLLGISVPVGNLKIRVQYGLNIIDNYTASNGNVTISGNINDNASVYVVYDNDRWRISRKGSLLAYSLLLGKVSDFWPGSNSFYQPTLSHTYLTIHRAANYFFNDSIIVVPSCNYSIRINMNEIVADKHSYFTFVLGSPVIELSNFWAFNNGHHFYSAIHELTHFYHYLEKDSISLYNSVDQLIQESFAEYFAWHFSREYYTQKNGGVYNTSWDWHLGDSAQSWLYTGSSYYSPLYIDLEDDFNQYLEKSPLYTYNNDPISGLGLLTITVLAIQNDNWAALKSALSELIGTYYTQAEYNAFITPYDAYFN